MNIFSPLAGLTPVRPERSVISKTPKLRILATVAQGRLDGAEDRIDGFSNLVLGQPPMPAVGRVDKIRLRLSPETG